MAPARWHDSNTACNIVTARQKASRAVTSDGTGWAISDGHRLQLCDSDSQKVLPAVWLCDSMGKRTTSNRLQQATAIGAGMHGRAELFYAFRAVINAVPNS